MKSELHVRMTIKCNIDIPLMCYALIMTEHWLFNNALALQESIAKGKQAKEFGPSLNHTLMPEATTMTLAY